jgi:ketosteroid isomerase-like protein
VAPPGAAPTVRPDIQRQIVSRFQGGSGATELVRAIVEGDLAIVVYIDRSTVRFDDDREGPWILRVTEVFRKQGDSWIRLHRHADPLVRFRDLDSTRALLE